MIDQITVFLENKEGHLSSLCRALSDEGINMHALTIADTSSFGVVRIICDRPSKARQALADSGLAARITKVLAIEIDHAPGSLAKVLDKFDETGMNIEYGYCFSSCGGKATHVFKVHADVKAVAAISDAGFKLLEPQDVYEID